MPMLLFGIKTAAIPILSTHLSVNKKNRNIYSKLTAIVVIGSITLLVAGLGCRPASKKLSAAAEQRVRYDWNLKTTLAVYKTGAQDPRWDASVQSAFYEWARYRSHTLDSNENWFSLISGDCADAIAAGCNDPMIRYLTLRCETNSAGKEEAITDQYFEMVQQMEGSQYPPIRKYYAWLRAVKQLQYTYSNSSNIPPRLQQFDGWSRAHANLVSALSDQTMPSGEIYEACHEFLEEWRGSQDRYFSTYQEFENTLSDEQKNDSSFQLIKGEVYLNYAWQARGGGYANTITTEGAKLFEQRLAIAADVLEKAWKLDTNDSRIATTMISVEQGQGKGRSRMELWFKRAMATDSNNYSACYAKLQYLEPCWYGSLDEMLTFSRDCVANEQWGGRVPLILMEAHNLIHRQFVTDQAAQSIYWKQPQVWADIKSACERYFELYPDDTSLYVNYAWYAYQASQWNTLNEFIPKLGPANYGAFGGKDKFDQMVVEANQHSVGHKTEAGHPATPAMP